MNLADLDWLNPGRKVVCIDNTPTIGFNWTAGSQPELNRVYTIRGVGPTVYGGLGILLDEIRLWSPKRDCELPYRASRFRPVVEQRTDISMLTALLNVQHHDNDNEMPVPVKEDHV